MYNPYDRNTFFNQPNSFQTPIQLIKVSGLEGAKAYQMPPNSAVALFHESENVLFVKTTDGASFPTIRTFSFTEMQAKSDSIEYVTKADLESAIKSIKEEFNAKQSIPE